MDLSGEVSGEVCGQGDQQTVGQELRRQKGGSVHSAAETPLAFLPCVLPS